MNDKIRYELVFKSPLRGDSRLTGRAGRGALAGCYKKSGGSRYVSGLRYE